MSWPRSASAASRVETVEEPRVGRPFALNTGIARAASPLLAFTFTIFLLAQAGVPLTSGFMAKFGVVSALAEDEWYWLAVLAMVSTVIAAAVYLRIVFAMYVGTDKSDPAEHAGRLKTQPWTGAVEGEIKRPKVYDIEELMKLAPLEERV